MSKQLKRIRDNKGGEFVLPYQPNWSEHVWSTHFPRDSIEEDLVDLREAGIIFGRLCNKRWEDIGKLSSKFHPSMFFRCVINAANNAFHDRSTNGSLPPSDGDLLNPFTISANEYEDLADSVSDLYFMMMRENKKTWTSIDLPDHHQALPPEVGIAVLNILQQITVLRFCFDKVLFLGATIRNAEGKIQITSENYLYQEYIKRICIAISEDTDNAVGSHLKTMQYSHSIITDMAPYRVVSSLENNGGYPKILFGIVSEYRIHSRLLAIRRYVDSEYLFETLDQSGLDIVYAWDVLYSFCYVISQNTIDDAKMLTAAEYRQHDLIRMIVACLNITSQRARFAIEALTLKGSAQDGVWSRPIIPVDKSYVKIFIPAVLTISPVRFVHLTLANRNLRDKRGKVFEQKVLSQLKGFCEKNSISKSLVVLPKNHQIYKLIGVNKNETDLFAIIGNTLIVCDAKSVSHATTPREYYHAFKSLDKGSQQVRTRIKRIRELETQVKRIFGLNKLDIFGVVITNDRLFNGIMIDDIPIINLPSLIAFVRSNRMDFGVEIGSGQATKTVISYNDIDSFSVALRQHIRKPLPTSLRMLSSIREECHAKLPDIDLFFERYIVNNDKFNSLIESL